MSNFDIKINIKKLMDYSASLDNTPRKRTLLLMIELFANYIVELYLDMIEESIYSRRYKGSWEPLDEDGYLEYIGCVPKHHILYYIKEALQVKKIGYNFVVRFDPKYKYCDSSLTLSKVLRAIEYGTSKFNARPAIFKITRDIQDNILELWKIFLTMKGVVV